MLASMTRSRLINRSKAGRAYKVSEGGVPIAKLNEISTVHVLLEPRPSRELLDLNLLIRV